MNYLNYDYNFLLANQVTNSKALAHTRKWFGFIALSRSSLAFFLTRLVQLPAFGESLVSPAWVQSTILQSACLIMLRCKGPTTRGRPTYNMYNGCLAACPQCDSLIASNPSGAHSAAVARPYKQGCRRLGAGGHWLRSLWQTSYVTLFLPRGQIMPIR